MQIHLFIWEYFINFLEILLFYLFIHSKLHRNTAITHSLPKQLLFFLIQFVSLCLLNQADISSMVTVAMSCFFNILFALLFFDNAIALRIFWGCIYSIICMIADCITIWIPQAFSHVSALKLLVGGELRICFTLLYIALIAVFVFLSQNIGNKDLCLSPLQKFSYLAICAVGILMAHYILLITLDSIELFHNQAFTFSLIMVNLVFLVLFLSLLLYIYQLGHSKEQNVKLLEQQKIHELEEQEYDNLLRTTTALREMKHDIKIHLDVIQSLAANKNTDELLTYIKSYHHLLDQTHHLLSTGNTAIDCILSSKIDLCNTLGIKTSYSVMVPKDFPLNALPLSSLLGNLWNNAVEACQRLQKKHPDSHPYIQFYVKPFQHMVLIHIENSYDGYVKRGSNQTFFSVKTENGHGVGLKRICDIVEKADGILQINTDCKIFTVHIMIPIKEQANENVNHHS